MSKAPITVDEHALWLEHPVTRWVLSAMDAQATAQREHWQETSWDGGVSDPTLLLELRTRADTLKAMGEASYADLCRALEQDEVIDSR